MKRELTLRPFIKVDMADIERDEILNLLMVAINATIKAGAFVMEVYNSSDFQVNLKSDKTPLTLADRLAHESIKESLAKTYIPVLSEEGRNILYEERRNWEYFWIVDPLDGTKEFIKRNGEFTVNIALLKDGFPVIGVIYVPAVGDLYFSFKPEGAYKVSDIMPDKKVALNYDMLLGRVVKLPIPRSDNSLIVVQSRSHTSNETLDYIENLRKAHKSVELLPIGSSLKMCLLAEGRADIYPRLSLSSEWDTAAGQAIVEGAGLQVLEYGTNTRVRYNKESLLNPWFVIKGSKL